MIKTNILRIAAIVAILFLFLPILKAQTPINHKQIDSILSLVQKKYATISAKVPIWNEKWQDPEHNKLILVPIIKYKKESKGQKTLSIADTLLDIVAIDTTGRSVYIYNISNSSLSLKGRSSANILKLFDQQKSQNKKLFIYFFDRDANELDIVASCCSSDNLIKFSSKDVSNTADILEILAYKFGSVTNFEIYSRIEARKHQIARGISGKFSNFTIENNWQFYNHFFTKDRAGNLSLLLSELQLATGFSKKSMTDIKSAIKDKIENGNVIADFQVTNQMARDARYGNLKMIPFLGVDILPILSKYLSGQKLDAYMIAYQINSGASVRMQSSLGARFKGKKAAIENYVGKHIVVKSQKPLRYSLHNDQKNPARITIL